MSAAIPSVELFLNFPELTPILQRTPNAFAPWQVT
jgi:hypothetical protein